jgi:hypothetical protein
MLEKRSTIDGCVADLEMAQKTLYQISNGQGASEEQINKAAIHAKRLELKLAVAKLGQAEYYLSSLSARVDYLEARLSRDGVATKTEREELIWAREALPINKATVTRLTDEVELRKRELDEMLKQIDLDSLAATNAEL